MTAPPRSTSGTAARSVSIALQTDKTARQYARLATAAEALGFDGVSVFADLGFQPPAAALAVIADNTSRVRIGAACQNPTLLHPVEIAGQLATLDLLSNGRGYGGLVRGAWLDGFGGSATGGLSRLTECVTILRAVLAGDDSGYQGRHFTVPPGFRLQFPIRRNTVEILIGTWGPRTAALAVALEVDEVKIGGTANPDMVRLMRSRLGPALGLVAGAVTVCDADPAAARRLARREVAMYLDVVAALDPTVAVAPDELARMRERLALGDLTGAAGSISDDTLSRFAFAGTPAQIADQANALYEAGATRVEFGTPHGIEPLEGLTLLGQQTLPALDRPKR